LAAPTAHSKRGWRCSSSHLMLAGRWPRPPPERDPEKCSVQTLVQTATSPAKCPQWTPHGGWGVRRGVGMSSPRIRIEARRSPRCVGSTTKRVAAAPATPVAVEAAPAKGQLKLAFGTATTTERQAQHQERPPRPGVGSPLGPVVSPAPTEVVKLLSSTGDTVAPSAADPPSSTSGTGRQQITRQPAGLEAATPGGHRAAALREPPYIAGFSRRPAGSPRRSQQPAAGQSPANAAVPVREVRVRKGAGGFGFHVRAADMVVDSYAVSVIFSCVPPGSWSWRGSGVAAA
jgi:hypothetical protein